MLEYEKSGEYLKAAKIKEHVERIRNQEDVLKGKELELKHKKLLCTVKTTEKRYKRKLWEEWKKKKEVYDEQARQCIKDKLVRCFYDTFKTFTIHIIYFHVCLQSKHSQYMEELRDRITAEYKGKPIRFSTKLLELRKSEKILAGVQNYKEAASIKVRMNLTIFLTFL
jgi:hypothetical protein